MPEPNIQLIPQAAAPRPSDQAVVRKLLTSEGTFATTLLVLACDLYVTAETPLKDVLAWSPHTFRMELEQDFGVTLEPHTVSKLMAAVAIVTTNYFFVSLDRFLKLANVLAGGDFDPSSFIPADAVECAWAITEALLLDPPDQDNPEPFTDEIRHYVGAVLREEGFVRPPDILKIALDADWSAQVSYDFAGDPDMFSGIYAVQTEKTEEVTRALQHGLLELLGQLKALPVRQGSTDELEGRIAQMIRQSAGG